MDLFVRVLVVLAYFAAATYVILPVVAVFVGLRSRRGEPSGRLTPRAVYIICGVAALLAPMIASMLTTSWDPLPMLAFSASGWALSGGAAVFLWRYLKGASVVGAVVQALLGACVAPFLGFAWVIFSGVL